MDKKSFIFKFTLSLFIFVILSCDTVTLSTPKNENLDNSANMSSSVLAPTGLSASNGEFRKIDLTWNAVKGAKRYFVFAAQNPSEPFKQIWETSSLNFSDECGSGKNKYYKVVAENYAGVKSSFSTFVLGSSLAKPVITSIEMEDEGSIANVNWWMENCDKNTYQNKINYTLNVYKEDKTTIVKTLSFSSDTDYSAKVEGLSPNTSYNFEIEAYCTQSQSKSEKSDLVDEKTARALIPSAPTDFVAARGIGKDEIELSWILPEYVDVKTGTETYERHPPYFKIFRKEEGSGDSEYKEIVSYIGSVLQGDAGSKKYKFDCSSNSTSDAKLSVVCSNDVQAEKSNLYSYVSLSKITYKDSFELRRGVKYSYKIQSFVDDVSKSISSKKSCSQVEGWLIPIADFRANSFYTKNGDSTEFTKIEIKFDIKFENFGESYSYILKETKTDLDDANPIETKIDFSSIDEIKSYVRIFDSPSQQKGYYRYSLFVADFEDKSKIYTSVDSLGKFIVTDNASGIPKIENFTVEDGYSDKFKISFSYNASYSYKLKWKNIVEGIPKDEQILALTTESLTIASGIAYFEHSAVSGERRIYTLEANNLGISVEKQAEGTFETLGTAKIELHSPLYDKIIFSWKPVQKADSYKVQAFYQDEPSNPFTVTESDTILDSDHFVCTIEKPFGWNDAKISGKKVQIKVIAKNSSTNKETTSQDFFWTLGPALTDTVFYSSGTNFISIKWKSVVGAKGYIVARARCSDGTSAKLESFDTYFISADGEKINIEGERVDSARAEVFVQDSYFILKDKYAETSAKETSQIAYKKNQSKISWGLEYKYCVIPVLSEDDFVFEVKNDSSAKLTDSSKVLYKNLSFVSAGATGYGLELRASKASDASKINLTWKQPFGATSTTKTPSIYSKKSGSSEEKWTFVKSVLSSTEEICSTQIEPKELTTAYDFAVVYNNFSTTVSIFPSFEENLKSVFDEKYSPKETLNKGYTLALQGIYADYVEGFTEQVSWNPYDFDSRKVGPQKYEIQVKNMNSSKGWVTIADIGVDTANSDFGTVADISKYAGDAKISLVKNGNNILQIKPIFDLNGTNTSGVLKVLRDYKHYYRLVAMRKVDETVVEASVGSDLSAFAYRNITDEELAKSALLALSYTFFINDGGKEDLSNASSQFKYGDAHTLTSDNGGNAEFKKGSYYWVGKYIGKYYADYKLKNYAPIQLNPSGTKTNFLSLTSATGSSNTFNMRGLSDYYLYTFLGENKIDIKAANSDLKTDYAATVNFTASDEKNFTLSITRSGSTKIIANISNSGERKKWFPMQINPDSQYEIKNSSSGWWED
ncbi:hypothetical protein [Treponema pectinovorum]|uniref:hypothetical protein n=1 Tax=Treponema pectinovorum TaxID=164 RepID=UPI0011F10303|nr:hypothetical protein [Treponema pectinovorum]